jgi:hypothetical protein
VLLAGAGAIAGAATPAVALARPRRVTGATVPPAAVLPADAYVRSYRQKWALSCEYAAVHTALRLLGFDVSEEVMRALLGSGEDPDETFRGQIQANQTLDDYGVHARGIARLVGLLGAAGYLPGEAQAQLLYDLDSLRLELANGRPALAWLPLDLRRSSRVAVRLSSGKVVNLVPAEHCITLHGYEGSQFLALDPHGGPPAYDAEALWRGMSLFDDPALALSVPGTPASMTEALAPTSQGAASGPPA